LLVFHLDENGHCEQFRTALALALDLSSSRTSQEVPSLEQPPETLPGPTRNPAHNQTATKASTQFSIAGASWHLKWNLLSRWAFRVKTTRAMLLMGPLRLSLATPTLADFSTPRAAEPCHGGRPLAARFLLAHWVWSEVYMPMLNPKSNTLPPPTSVGTTLAIAGLLKYLGNRTIICRSPPRLVLHLLFVCLYMFVPSSEPCAPFQLFLPSSLHRSPS
jgi:hypothetical protein